MRISSPQPPFRGFLLFLFIFYCTYFGYLLYGVDGGVVHSDGSEEASGVDHEHAMDGSGINAVGDGNNNKAQSMNVQSSFAKKNFTNFIQSLIEEDTGDSRVAILNMSSAAKPSKIRIAGQFFDGDVITISSGSQQVFSRCEGCGAANKAITSATKGSVSDVVTTRITFEAGRTDAWRVQYVGDGNRVRFRSDNGRYLQRTDYAYRFSFGNCCIVAVDALTDKAPGVVWTMVGFKGRYILQSDNGYNLVYFGQFFFACPTDNSNSTQFFFAQSPLAFGRETSVKRPFIQSNGKDILAPFAHGDGIQIQYVDRGPQFVQWGQSLNASRVLSKIGNITSNMTDVVVMGLDDYSYRSLFRAYFVGDPRKGLLQIKTLDGRYLAASLPDAGCQSCPWNNTALVRVQPEAEGSLWSLVSYSIRPDAWKLIPVDADGVPLNLSSNTNSKQPISVGFPCPAFSNEGLKPFVLGTDSNEEGKAWYIWFRVLPDEVVDRIVADVESDTQLLNSPPRIPSNVVKTDDAATSAFLSMVKNGKASVALMDNRTSYNYYLTTGTNSLAVVNMANLTSASRKKWFWNLRLELPAVDSKMVVVSLETLGGLSVEVGNVRRTPNYNGQYVPSMYSVFVAKPAKRQRWNLHVMDRGIGVEGLPNASWYLVALEHPERRGWFLTECTGCSWIYWGRYDVQTALKQTDASDTFAVWKLIMVE